MKNIILAYIALGVGLLLTGIPQLTEFLKANDFLFLTQKEYILPVFFALVLLVIKGIYDITKYTDETIPLKLSVLSLGLAIFGYFVFFRILLLGVIILIVAAYWKRGIVRSYYPRGRYIP